MSDSAASAHSKTHTKQIPVKATEAIAKGDVVNWKKSVYDGLSIEQPEADNGLVGNFAGVATADIDSGDQRAVVAVEGKVIAKVKGATTAAQGRSLLPTDDQDYFTDCAEETGIELLTDLTADTNVHGPDDGASAPQVWLRPRLFGRVPHNTTIEVKFADVSTADTEYSVSWANLELVAAYAVTETAITVADSNITIGDGTNTAGTIVVAVATAANEKVYEGTLSATVANRRFTRGERIEVATDGGSTTASETKVVLVFKEY